MVHRLLLSRLRCPFQNGIRAQRAAFFLSASIRRGIFMVSSGGQCGGSLPGSRSKLLPVDRSARLDGESSPWSVQKRFMGGPKKSMARARKNFAKKLKKVNKLRELQKREKVNALENQLKDSSRMRMVWNLKLVLASRNGRVLPSIEFQRLSRELGFPNVAFFVRFIQRFPGIFKLARDKNERRLSWLEFSEEADALLDEEEKINKEYHEPLIVKSLRKLLMMMPSRRVLISKVAHLRTALWLPDDFKVKILEKYPQFFKITGAYVELVGYDSSLAKSVRETQWEQGFKLGCLKSNFGQNERYGFNITVGHKTQISGKILLRLLTFQQLPFPGPYDPSIENVHPRSPEAQKRSVAVCHEFLSLTVEKRAYIDNLAFLSRELILPLSNIEELLARHPHIFYVSRKLDRHVVFLKEWYKDGQLAVKHPLIDLKAKFEKLMDFKTKKVTSLDDEDGAQIVVGGRGKICADDFVSTLQKRVFQQQIDYSQGPQPKWSFPVQNTPGPGTSIAALNAESSRQFPAGPALNAGPSHQGRSDQPWSFSVQNTPGPGTSIAALNAGSSRQGHSDQPSAGPAHSPYSQTKKWTFPHTSQAQDCQICPEPTQLQLPGPELQHQQSSSFQGRVPEQQAIAARGYVKNVQISQPGGPSQAKDQKGGEGAPEPASEMFLQIGFSESEEEAPKPPQPKVSLAKKLGMVSDSEDEKEPVVQQAAVINPNELWAWKAPTPAEREEKYLFDRRKRKSEKNKLKKPFWEIKPFDTFDDPFF